MPERNARHILGVFHRWECVETDPADGLNPPYMRCKVCGETKTLGDPCRWGVGMDGKWFYDEAQYE